MNEAQRRFTVVSKPPALPGVCFVCSGEDREWFIDVNRDIEFHGAAYICSECFKEFASMVNYVPVGDIGQIEDQILAIKNWDEEITSTIEGLADVHGSIGDSLASLGSFRGSLITDASDVSAPADDSDGVSGKAESGSSDGEGTSDESGDEPGLADVRSAPKQSDFKFGDSL